MQFSLEEIFQSQLQISVSQEMPNIRYNFL